MQPQIIPASQYNGIWCGDDKNTITSINPTTQKPLGELRYATLVIVRKMIEQAKKINAYGAISQHPNEAS